MFSDDLIDELKDDHSNVSNPDHEYNLVDDEDEGEDLDPTHECRVCNDQKYIESAPTTERSWCDTCGSVRRWTRLD